MTMSMTLSGSDLQAVLQNVLKKLDLFIYIKIYIIYLSVWLCLWLCLARTCKVTALIIPRHIVTAASLPTHTVQVCTSTYSASTQAQKHTQCKQCKICSTHLYPHCPDHTLSGRHLHKQSFRAAFHWCTAFQGCSELSFSLDSHSALLFTALRLAFHWGWSGAMSLSWSCSCTLAAPRSQWAGPGQCTKPNFIV